MIKKQVTVDQTLPVDQNIEKVIALCNQMLALADLADDGRDERESGVFYNALRDSAYKIRRLAKNELTRQENLRLPPT